MNKLAWTIEHNSTNCLDILDAHGRIIFNITVDADDITDNEWKMARFIIESCNKNIDCLDKC